MRFEADSGACVQPNIWPPKGQFHYCALRPSEIANQPDQCPFDLINGWDLALLEILLRKSEGDTLDFKKDQYQFGKPASKEDESKLLKDILAFANAWKDADAHIIVGVAERDQRVDSICGMTSHLPDHIVQQFVNTKTNTAVKFSVEAVQFKEFCLDVIRINRSQNRPVFATDQFGNVLKNAAYVRRGSATAIADPDEIAAMGKEAVTSEAVPNIMLEFADPFHRIRQGTELEVASMHLVDPARPIAPLAAESPRIVPPGLLDHLSDPRPPSNKEWIEYLKDRALFQPIGFWLKNIGSVNATNIKVEFRLPPAGLTAVTTYCGPRKPQSIADDLRYGWAEPPLPVWKKTINFWLRLRSHVSNHRLKPGQTEFSISWRPRMPSSIATPRYLQTTCRHHCALQCGSHCSHKAARYESAELFKLVKDTESDQSTAAVVGNRGLIYSVFTVSFYGRRAIPCKTAQCSTTRRREFAPFLPPTRNAVQFRENQRNLGYSIMSPLRTSSC